MAEHYTRNTVSATAWCSKCQKRTMHRVDDRRISICLECADKLERDHESRKEQEKPAEQSKLF